MRDGDSSAAQIKSMHQDARDHAVDYAHTIRPSRPSDRDDNGHQPNHYRHADRQIDQRFRILQDVFGSNKAGTPEHDKNRRRRARGKIL
jgi:hypothetical protein